MNILKGEMSVVGPRPLIPELGQWLADRHATGADRLRPGLTGWAQVNGRDALSSEEKARLDGEYARRVSFMFDLKCLYQSVGVVLRKTGFIEGNRERGFSTSALSTPAFSNTQ